MSLQAAPDEAGSTVDVAVSTGIKGNRFRRFGGNQEAPDLAADTRWHKLRFVPTAVICRVLFPACLNHSVRIKVSNPSALESIIRSCDGGLEGGLSFLESCP